MTRSPRRLTLPTLPSGGPTSPSRSGSPPPAGVRPRRPHTVPEGSAGRSERVTHVRAVRMLAPLGIDEPAAAAGVATPAIPCP